MTPREYQEQALQVKLYHEAMISPLFSKVSYLVMGLSGETGELAEKVKKIIRDKDCQLSEVDRFLLQKELGDVLWYLTAIISELGLSLEDTMEVNLSKIQDRINRDQLQGSGDER